MTTLGIRWFEIAGTGIRDEHGRVVGIRAIGRDITERRAAEMEQRRAEAALHESEARYRGIVESTQAVFTRTDREGRLLYANDAICRLVGVPLEAILGQSFFQWVHPDDQAATLAAMEAAQQPPYRVLVENRVPTLGGWRWFEWEAGVDPGRGRADPRVPDDRARRHRAEGGGARARRPARPAIGASSSPVSS